MAEEVLFEMELEAREASRRVAKAAFAKQFAAPRRRTSSASGNESDTGSEHATNGNADGHANGHAGNSSGSGLAVQWDGQRLYWFDECPPVLQYNRFVRSGYRAGMTYPQCLCSIFSYHNETGNILTHLLPAIVLAACLVTGWLPSWEGFRPQFFGNVLPILVCLCGSVSYHTFMAHHYKYRSWLMLDVCGIFVLFLSGMQVVAWWGLRCYPALRAAYVCCYYALAGVAILSALRAKTAMMRALPMLALFLFRISLTGVRLYLGAGSPVATRHYAAMEVFSLVGGTLNAMRAPERWFQPKPGRPGIFDYWLNSHQLMHIFVVCAMAHLHTGATADYHDLVSGNSCGAYSGY